MKKITERFFKDKVKVYINIIYILLFIAVTKGYSAVNIIDLNVTPATVAPGGQITINFRIANNANYAHCFAVAVTAFNTPETFRCGMDWLASSEGIYARTTSTQTYYYDGTSATIAGKTTTTDEIEDGEGICLPANGTNVYRSVTIVANVPPEKAGTYYIAVVGRGNNTNDIRWECNDGLLRDDTEVSSAFTISGAVIPYKLDLEWCEKQSDTSKIEIYYRIVNYSESGVPLNDLKWRYYIYDTDTAWTQSAGTIQKVYKAGGSLAYGPDVTSSYNFQTISSVDCGSSRQANLYYERYFNITSGTAAYITIPPAGGYVQNYGSQELILRQSDGGTINHSDDYSNITALTCYNSAPTEDMIYGTLYHNNFLVCEWDSASAQDDLTGEEPCGISGCTLRAEKSTSRTSGTIGDTITFCITVTSTASSDLETYIWDTVPANTAYVGCDNGCDYSGGIVSWFTALAPGYSATRCFWVRISGYPFLYMERERFAGVRLDVRSAMNVSAVRYQEDDIKFWLALTKLHGFKN